MTRRPLLFRILLTLSALAAAGAARAADPEAPPVATAPVAGPSAPMSIGEQIDNYLKTSPAAALPKDAATGVTSGAASGDEPRKVHGVVDLAAGSNGYRSAFVASELPVGKTGTATIAVSETQFKGRFGGYGGYGGPFAPQTRQSVGLGLSFTGSSDAADPRCREAAEDGAVNLDPRFGGGRVCRPLTP